MASRFRSAVKRATFDFFPAFIQALTLADARTRNKNSQTIKKLTFQRFFLPFSIPTSRKSSSDTPNSSPTGNRATAHPFIPSCISSQILRACVCVFVKWKRRDACFFVFDCSWPGPGVFGDECQSVQFDMGSLWILHQTPGTPGQYFPSDKSFDLFDRRELPISTICVLLCRLTRRTRSTSTQTLLRTVRTFLCVLEEATESLEGLQL